MHSCTLRIAFGGSSFSRALANMPKRSPSDALKNGGKAQKLSRPWCNKIMQAAESGTKKMLRFITVNQSYISYIVHA